MSNSSTKWIMFHNAVHGSLLICFILGFCIFEQFYLNPLGIQTPSRGHPGKGNYGPWLVVQWGGLLGFHLVLAYMRANYYVLKVKKNRQSNVPSA